MVRSREPLVGANHISGMAEARVNTFCRQVGCIKSQHMEDRSPLKAAWSWSLDAFKIVWAQWYFWIGWS